MSIQVNAIASGMNAGALSATGSSASPAGLPSPTAEPFGNLLKSTIGDVNGLEQTAANATQGLLEGNGIDMQDAFISVQKADMAFEMTLAVRNKAVAAYQQIMGMQF